MPVNPKFVIIIPSKYVQSIRICVLNVPTGNQQLKTATDKTVNWQLTKYSALVIADLNWQPLRHQAYHLKMSFSKIKDLHSKGFLSYDL